MGSQPTGGEKPWTRTPCVYSPELSKVAACNVHLKLENTQPSGSFKSRGIGTLMTRAIEAAAAKAATAGAKRGPVHFYCSSGGNAGLACTTAAAQLGLGATIMVPNMISEAVVAQLRARGAEVHRGGAVWAEADKKLREELLAHDPNGVYVPPFDHPDVWDGASTMVDELREDLASVPLDAVVCSVGGGGLVNGMMQGLSSAPWPCSYASSDPSSSPPSPHFPRVLAVETEGADSLNASVCAGEHVTLPAITSIAKTLGATHVSAQTWEYARQSLRPLRQLQEQQLQQQPGSGSGSGPRLESQPRQPSSSPLLDSLVVSDADAALSCVRFADDARILVEPACGAALAVVYRADLLRQRLGAGLSDEEWSRRNVVIVVCGGTAISLDLLSQYKKEYAGQSSIKV